MKRKAFVSLTITLLICLLMNTISTFSLQTYEEKNMTINEYDYSSWYWTGTEIMSDMSSANTLEPAIVADSENNIHIVWFDNEDYAGAGIDNDIFYRYWSSSSRTWSSVEVVSTVSTGNSRYPEIDVDMENNIHIVWEDTMDYDGAGSDFDIFYRKKNTATDVWETTQVVSHISTTSAFKADISVDKSENVNIVWCDGTDYNSSGTDSDIFYKQWDNDLSSWSETSVVSTESTSGSLTPSILSDSLGNVYFLWDDTTDYAGSGTDSDIFFKSINPEGGWSPLIVLSHMSSTSSAAAKFDCNEQDLLSVVWIDYEQYLDSGSDGDVYHTSYSVDLDLWSEIELISELNTYTSFAPSVSVDIFGNIHTVWFDGTPLGGSGLDYDIHYRRKDSETQLWSPLYIVSSGNNYDGSYYPDITTDDIGYAHVVWRDSTSMGGAGSDNDVFYNKLVGPPEKPILASFTPNPIFIGDFNVDWSDCLGAAAYDVYREESYIWSVSGLTPLDTISASEYYDSINDTGTYYYTIVAKNRYGESSLSNIEPITINEEALSTGFFQSLRLGEIVVLAAIIGGIQLLITTIVVVFVKTGPKIRSPKTGKK